MAFSEAYNLMKKGKKVYCDGMIENQYFDLKGLHTVSKIREEVKTCIDISLLFDMCDCDDWHEYQPVLSTDDKNWLLALIKPYDQGKGGEIMLDPTGQEVSITIFRMGNNINMILPVPKEYLNGLKTNTKYTFKDNYIYDNNVSK